jgi:hypothetical protein
MVRLGMGCHRKFRISEIGDGSTQGPWARTKRFARSRAVVLVLGSACATAPAPPTGPEPAATDRGAAAGPMIRSDAEPSLATLSRIVNSGSCTRLDAMPGLLARLDDPEFRTQLGRVAAEGHDEHEALTVWLVLAHAYQRICNTQEAAQFAASVYIFESAPLPEPVVENALEHKLCGFLSAVDDLQVWPYELRMGQEVLGREFKNAEVTRRLWLNVLDEFSSTCQSTLSRRGRIRIEAQRERLTNIVGLDDPTLIELRSNMLAALEGGDQDKVLAYARAVSEREISLDSRRAAVYEAKLANIEKKLAEQVGLADPNSKDLVAKTQQAADASGNVAETASNVATTAAAAAQTIGILRSLF